VRVFEVLKDAVTEMAPLSHADAIEMITRIKGASILQGARGRPRHDTDALAAIMVGLGTFAIKYAARFAAIDLNPIIVGAERDGAFAVDIVLESVGG
jgi:acetate---CoA ligase (ADP-forming)